MLALSSFFLPLCVSEQVKPYKTMATTLMSVPPSTCRHLLKLEGKEDIVIFLHELIRDSRYYYIIVIYSNCAVLSVNLFLTKKKKKNRNLYILNIIIRSLKRIYIILSMQDFITRNLQCHYQSEEGLFLVAVAGFVILYNILASGRLISKLQPIIQKTIRIKLLQAKNTS